MSSGWLSAVEPEYRPATPEDAPECFRIRGLTRENALSGQRLHELGITPDSWAKVIRTGELPGFVCTVGGDIAGYCFGDSKSGEVIVLVVLPAYENRGIGRKLLGRVVRQLGELGHERLFLGCSSNPSVRSHGFYRHLGWRSTGAVDQQGDEILELLSPRTMPQVKLSPLQESHAADLQRIWLDHETVRFTNWTLLSTREEVAERVRRILVRYATSERRGPFLIQNADGEFVGLIGVDYGNGEHEVWYILDRSQWGKGFGAAALSHLLERVTTPSGITRLFATAVASNMASWRLLERNGFTRVACVVGGFQKEGVSEDLYRYETFPTR